MERDDGKANEQERHPSRRRKAPRTERVPVGRLLPRVHRDADVRLGPVIAATFGVCGRALFPLLGITLLLTPPIAVGVYLQFPATEHPQLTNLQQHACQQLATLYLAFWFAVAQALVFGGTLRALERRPFGLAQSLRDGVRPGASVVATALRTAGIVWLWNLLCGIGILWGVRSVFVAMPLLVQGQEGSARPQRSSAHVMQAHLGKIVVLCIVFVVLYFIGALVAMAVLAAFAVLNDAPDLSPFEAMEALVIPISLWASGLITFWSVLTSVFLRRMTEPDGALSDATVADVF